MDLCLGRNWARFTASFLALVAGASINFRRESSKRGPKSGPQYGLQFGSAAASSRPKLSPKSGLENGPRTSQVGPWPLSSCPRGMLRWCVYLPRKQREARTILRQRQLSNVSRRRPASHSQHYFVTSASQQHVPAYCHPPARWHRGFGRIPDPDLASTTHGNHEL